MLFTIMHHLHDYWQLLYGQGKEIAQEHQPTIIRCLFCLAMWPRLNVQHIALNSFVATWQCLTTHYKQIIPGALFYADICGKLFLYEAMRVV